MPAAASSSISASSSRCARLYWFCTQTISAMPRALGDLLGRHVAEPDMADEALPLQLGERRQRRLDRALGRAVDVEHDAQVDDLERVEPQVAQVVVHRAASDPRPRTPGFHEPSAPRRAPTLVTITRSSRIGMQRLADELVGDVRAVEVARVDVVRRRCHRLAQHGERAVAVLRRPEDARARRAASRRSRGASRVRSPSVNVPALLISIMRCLLRSILHVASARPAR